MQPPIVFGGHWVSSIFRIVMRKCTSTLPHDVMTAVTRSMCAGTDLIPVDVLPIIFRLHFVCYWLLSCRILCASHRVFLLHRDLLFFHWSIEHDRRHHSSHCLHAYSTDAIAFQVPMHSVIVALTCIETLRRGTAYETGEEKNPGALVM